MHSSIITKCLDKNIQTVLCHLSYQSYRFESIHCVKKQRSPLLTLKSNFTYILDSILEKQIALGASNEFQKFIEEHAVGTKPAVNTIMTILKVDVEYAKDIVTYNKQFGYISCKTITNNYKILEKAGMSLSNLQFNPKFLSENSDNLQSKIQNVHKLVDDINYGIPLLYHSARNLDQFIKSISDTSHDCSIRNKVIFYKEHWNVENKELCKLLGKYLYFLINHPQKTESMIKLLLDNKVTVNSLLKKRWNILMNIEKARKRLKMCSELGFLSPIEPWIFTNNDIEFERKIQVQDCKQASSKEYWLLVELLSQNSGYSTQLIRHRFSIYCHFENIDFNKIKEIPYIILKEGYEWHDIVWYIKVLTLPKELIVERFSELKRINHKTQSLAFLLMSNENFDGYVHKYKNKYSLIF